MRSFTGFNQSGEDKCLICNTNEDCETVLIGVSGTENGGIMEAKQFHLKCIDLTFKKEGGRQFLFQRIVKP